MSHDHEHRERAPGSAGAPLAGTAGAPGKRARTESLTPRRTATAAAPPAADHANQTPAAGGEDPFAMHLLGTGLDLPSLDDLPSLEEVGEELYDLAGAVGEQLPPTKAKPAPAVTPEEMEEAIQQVKDRSDAMKRVEHALEDWASKRRSGLTSFVTRVALEQEANPAAGEWLEQLLKAGLQSLLAHATGSFFDEVGKAAKVMMAGEGLTTVKRVVKPGFSIRPKVPEVVKTPVGPGTGPTTSVDQAMSVAKWSANQATTALSVAAGDPVKTRNARVRRLDDFRNKVEDGIDLAVSAPRDALTSFRATENISEASLAQVAGAMERLARQGTADQYSACVHEWTLAVSHASLGTIDGADGKKRSRLEETDGWFWLRKTPGVLDVKIVADQPLRWEHLRTEGINQDMLAQVIHDGDGRLDRIAMPKKIEVVFGPYLATRVHLLVDETGVIQHASTVRPPGNDSENIANKPEAVWHWLKAMPIPHELRKGEILPESVARKPR